MNTDLAAATDTLNAATAIEREASAYATVNQQIRELENSILNHSTRIEEHQASIRHERKAIRHERDDLKRLRARRAVFARAEFQLRRIEQE